MSSGLHDEFGVRERVRAALGRRGEARHKPPPPPEIPDAVARLVTTSADKLPQLFAKQAGELKMIVTETSEADAADKLVAFVKSTPIKTVAMAVSPLLRRLGLRAALERAGIDVRTWDEMTLDEAYDVDCGITDVIYAVAESGTLVIRPSSDHGRALSLVPMYHIAFVEPGQVLADMVDLFERLSDESCRSNVILISGPSKTADIEMNVVTGVHGPNVVNAFILK